MVFPYVLKYPIIFPSFRLLSPSFKGARPKGQAAAGLGGTVGLGAARARLPHERGRRCGRDVDGTGHAGAGRHRPELGRWDRRDLDLMGFKIQWISWDFSWNLRGWGFISKFHRDSQPSFAR